MPALPLADAGKYVAAAYIVLLTLLGLYLAIMTRKYRNAERRLSELDERLREREQ